MARDKQFNFPIGTLLHESDAVLKAAEANAVTIDPRLPAGYVASTRTVHEGVSTQHAEQQAETGAVGTLTREQKKLLKTLRKLMAGARATAKRAFRGDKVRLRNQFQVGLASPSGLSAILSRARIILESCRDQAPALAAKGWVGTDTQALAAAIDALDAADDTQEATKATKIGLTGARNEKANDLFQRVLVIQNAANLQWPADQVASLPFRELFRLDLFPPRPKTKPEPEPEAEAETGNPGAGKPPAVKPQ